MLPAQTMPAPVEFVSGSGSARARRFWGCTSLMASGTKSVGAAGMVGWVDRRS